MRVQGMPLDGSLLPVHDESDSAVAPPARGGGVYSCGRRHVSTVYYCWLCDEPAAPGLSDVHYEHDRTVRFCSDEHASVYEWLRKL